VCFEELKGFYQCDFSPPPPRVNTHASPALHQREGKRLADLTVQFKLPPSRNGFRVNMTPDRLDELLAPSEIHMPETVLRKMRQNFNSHSNFFVLSQLLNTIIVDLQGHNPYLNTKSKPERHKILEAALRKMENEIVQEFFRQFDMLKPKTTSES
jgi:hypothetical protein